MKRHLLALLSCVLLLAVTGCKDKNTTPQSLKGNEARPTWTAPDEYDYSSSMTAVILMDTSDMKKLFIILATLLCTVETVSAAWMPEEHYATFCDNFKFD